MIIYFFIVAVGSFIAGRLILGELRKERRDYVLVSPSSEISKPNVHSETAGEYISPAEYIPVNIDAPVRSLSDWEKILIEKNAEIEKLSRELAFQKSQTQDIEKIKALLERQIFESRQMSRNVKRELDAVMAQGAKSQDEIARLQRELNYKNQLINQNEIKMSELKNRITPILPNTSDNNSESIHKQDQDVADFSFDQLDWRKKLNE